MGARITVWGADWLQGITKSPNNVTSTFSSIQYISFRRRQVRTWGRQICFLPRAPSDLVTTLKPALLNRSRFLTCYCFKIGPCTYRRLRASADRVNVWSLLYIIRELNHYWNMKWTMKRSSHHWDEDHIIRFVNIVCYMQYIYFFS